MGISFGSVQRRPDPFGGLVRDQEKKDRAPTQQVGEVYCFPVGHSFVFLLDRAFLLERVSALVRRGHDIGHPLYLPQNPFK